MDLYYCGLKGHFYTNTMGDKTNLILPDYEYALPSSFIVFNLVTYLYLDYMMDPNLRNGEISCFFDGKTCRTSRQCCCIRRCIIFTTHTTHTRLRLSVFSRNNKYFNIRLAKINILEKNFITNIFLWQWQDFE